MSLQIDPIKPFIYPEAKVLILGTFPAPKARESGFYYAHPSNRFWKVMASVFDEGVPETIEQRKDFLRQRKIALWNMIHACSIDGAKDSSIKDIQINDIARAISKTQIKQIFTSGRLASKLYRQNAMAETGIKDIYLPSTSGANRANFTFEQLVDEHKKILEFL